MAHRTPLVFPAAGRHTATVIFAHGLGDSGHGWSFLVENWRRRQRLEHVKFVLPHAPQIPITVNGGMRMPAWYDISALGDDIARMRAQEDERGILESRAYVKQLVQQEVESGIPADRIVLGGFSQGGALALFSALTNPSRLAGIVVLSAYLLLSANFDSVHLPQGAANVNAQTPIFIGHGMADPIVPFRIAQLTRDHLQRLNYTVEFHQYSGLVHSVDDEEVQAVESFLNKVLPPLPEGKAEL